MLPDEQASPQQLAILRRMTGQRRLRLAEEPIWLAPPEYTIVRKLEYFREGGSESIYAMFVPCWPYRVNPSTELPCWIGLPGGGFKLSGKAFLGDFLPVGLAKVFQEFAPDVLACVESVDNRVDDARRPVDAIKWRMELMVSDLASGNRRGILIGYPTGVHCVHMNAIGMIVCSGGAGHHVESGFSHVGVGMPGRLESPVKFSFHGRDIDDVLIAPGTA